MKLLSYLFIGIGICSWVVAADDEQQDVIFVTPPCRSALPVEARKSENPKLFQRLISYEWGRGLLFVTAGCLGLVFCRKVDQSNPFSTE